jgi:integral membrane protein
MRRSNPIPLLRSLALVEGTSFLVLLGVAMPLKYLAGQPMAVSIVGWIHGVLFLAFSLALLRVFLVARWTLARSALVFVAALIPFGPFLLDRKMLAYAEEFECQEVKNPRADKTIASP